MAEGKARNRVESSDSARERNAEVRPQGPAVARMDFFNGLLSANTAIAGATLVVALVVFASLYRRMLQETRPRRPNPSGLSCTEP